MKNFHPLFTARWKATTCICIELLSIFCIFTTVFPNSSSADDWRQFRGENRDGKAETITISSNWYNRPPEFLKTLAGAGQGFASLCVVDGTIYTTGNSDSDQFVVAIQMSTGEVIWQQTIVPVVPNHDYLGSRSTPTYDPKTERLFVVGSDGRLVCLDAKLNYKPKANQNGRILWQKQFQKEWNGRLMSGWGFSESPLVDGDQVIVSPGGRQALIVALKTVGKKESDTGIETGIEIWRCKPETTDRPLINSRRENLRYGASYSSMIIADLHNVKQYVQVTGDRIVSVDPDSGKIFWQNSLSANRIANVCSPVQIGDNKIFYSSAHNGGSTLLDIEIRRREEGVSFETTPIKTWPSQQMQCHHGGIIVDGDHAYLGNGMNRGFPMCVNLTSGKISWGGKLRGAGIGSAALVYCDRKIIFRYQDGTVALVEANPNRYNLLGKFMQNVKSSNRSWAHPVISNGKLLLREDDKIMIYDITR